MFLSTNVPAQSPPQLPHDAPEQGVGERRGPHQVLQREQRVRPHPQRGQAHPHQSVDLGRNHVLAAQPAHVRQLFFSLCVCSIVSL